MAKLDAPIKKIDGELIQIEDLPVTERVSNVGCLTLSPNLTEVHWGDEINFTVCSNDAAMIPIGTWWLIDSNENTVAIGRFENLTGCSVGFHVSIPHNAAELRIRVVCVDTDNEVWCMSIFRIPAKE